jgi:uncharacterized protein (DUF433 family)
MFCNLPARRKTLERESFGVSWIRRQFDLYQTCKVIQSLWKHQVLAYDGEMDYQKIIKFDPNIRSGKACVRGTRVTVSDVINLLAIGSDWTIVTNELPYITYDDIKACFAYVADRERKINSRVA